MGIPAIFSLTGDGIITDPNEIMSKLFEYYLTADKSQSNYFTGNVQSLKYTIDTEKTPSSVCSAIREDLIKLYSNYFSSVNVTVVDSNSDSTTSSVVYYKINIKAYDAEGNGYDLSKVVDNTLASTANYADALTKMIEKYTEG